MLKNNKTLENIYAQSAVEIGKWAFRHNTEMKSFIAPNMSKINKHTALTSNNTLPNLEHLHLADEVVMCYYRSASPKTIRVGNVEGKEEIERFKADLFDEPNVKIIEK